MAFNTIIGVTQANDCSQFQVTDLSTYTIEATSTFSLRKLTIQKSDGTYLTNNGITYNNYTWPFAAGNSIVMIDLPNDMAFRITLALTSNAPTPGSIYSREDAIALTCYAMSSFYANSHKMAVSQTLEKEYRFVKDLMRILIECESAKKAAIDDDLGASQSCLDRAKTVSDALNIGY